MPRFPDGHDRLVTLEWLTQRLATEHCLATRDPVAATRKIVADANEYGGALINAANVDDQLMIAIGPPRRSAYWLSICPIASPTHWGDEAADVEWRRDEFCLRKTGTTVTSRVKRCAPSVLFANSQKRSAGKRLIGFDRFPPTCVIDILCLRCAFRGQEWKTTANCFTDPTPPSRREKIQSWVKAALTKPDPANWVHAQFDDAFRHLDGHPDVRVKEQAKRELFDLRKDGSLVSPNDLANWTVELSPFSDRKVVEAVERFVRLLRAMWVSGQSGR